jgi:hypothetical protein
MHGTGEKSVQCFGGNPEGKRPLGRPRRRWEGEIKNGDKGYWLRVVE